MRQTSFQQILSQFMDDETVAPAAPASVFEAPTFHWQPSVDLKRSGAYPKSAPRPKPTPPPKPVEAKWLIATLAPALQKDIQNFVQMGAAELALEISLSTLKKAHRRLARQFHPDGLSPSPEKFLLAQALYEALSKQINALVRDSESASAQASQRPNAA